MADPLTDSMREGLQQKYIFMNENVALAMLLVIGVISIMGLIWLRYRKK